MSDPTPTWSPVPQSPTTFEIRLHPRSYWMPILGLITTVGAVILGVADVVEIDPRVWAIPFGAVVALVRVATTRISVDGEHVRARWGWLIYSDTAIPYSRIQDVEVTRSLWARVLGLTKVKISSAGGAGKIGIAYVDQPTADWLRGAVSAGHDHAGPHSARIDAPATALRETSVAEIARSQIGTALVWGVILAVVIAVSATVDGRVAFGALVPFLGAIGGVVIRLLAIGKNRLEISGDLLRLHQGVITLRTTSTPLKRIQMIRTSRGPIFQIAGWERIDFASAEAGEEAAERVRSLLAPAAKHGESVALSHVLLGLEDTTTRPTEFVPLGGQAVRASLIRAVLGGAFMMGITVAVASILNAALPSHMTADHSTVLRSDVVGLAWTLGLALSIVVVMFNLVAGFVRARRSGWVLLSDSIVVRDGVWLLRDAILPFSKVQATQSKESLVNRLSGTRSLFVDVAGNSGSWPVRLADMEPTRADELREFLASAAATRALRDGV